MKAVLLGGVVGIVAWLLGATWGGNHANDFVFAGLRGYEATGFLAAGIVTMLVGILVVAAHLKQTGNQSLATRALVIGVASGVLALGASNNWGFAVGPWIFLLPIVAATSLTSTTERERYGYLFTIVVMVQLMTLSYVASFRTPLENIYQEVLSDGPSLIDVP